MNIQEFVDKFKILSKKFNEIKNHLNMEKQNKTLNDLENKTLDSNFWNNPNKSNLILKKIKNLKKEIEFYNNIDNQYNYILMHIDEFDDSYKLDQSTIKELLDFSLLVDQLEIKMLLNEPDDQKNVILTIHPGAGGTESQDWVSILLRMYSRWAEHNDMRIDVVDLSQGEESGIKSVVTHISGDMAYGYLKSEHGVHRLVRLSPFDADHARHTSFALVEVLPEVELKTIG